MVRRKQRGKKLLNRSALHGWTLLCWVRLPSNENQISHRWRGRAWLAMATEARILVEVRGKGSVRDSESQCQAGREVGNAEFLTDLTQVSRGSVAILHHTGMANHFQVG